MSCYFIAVGGTGNKILESMVYAACAGVLRDAAGAPLSRLDALTVDVDTACGNTTRAGQAAELYERVRGAMAGAPGRGFGTELALDRWSMDLTRRAASVSGMTRNHRQDQLLARALFSRTEAELDYGEGFRGHPDLGVLFFSDMLSALDDNAAAGQPDEMNRLLSRMEDDLSRGETVRVLLAGSIFGGTGASGIPVLSQFLRRRFAARSDRFVLGAILMLPYYAVPDSGRDEREELVVKSSAFLDKAKTALHYYGMEGMIRSGEDDAKGVYDALYLLGLPREAFVTARLYSTGSQSQENDAHMLEWLASRCAGTFYRTGFRGESSANIRCYYYQWHARTFSWDAFDEESDRFRMGYGGLLKAAAAFFAECYPTLRARIREDARGRANLANYYAAFFSRVRHGGASSRARLEKNVDALYRLLAFYVHWMAQLLRTLPEGLRGADTDSGVPENELLDARLLGELCELLTLYGDENRDRARMAALRQSVCERVSRAVKRRVPDRVGMPKITAALGGGKPLGKGPDAAFAGFWATLLAAVLEEEGA
ncbi:MAG: hypothetical protein PHY12_00770 [Eubacteriales bacterium]|nr:hypothetical protein [Eubacteriales bacterium]